jgi:hypothetical protein
MGSPSFKHNPDSHNRPASHFSLRKCRYCPIEIFQVDTLVLGINPGGAPSGNRTVISAQGTDNNGGVITADGKLIAGLLLN